MARMMIKGEHCFSCGLMQFKVLGARCSLLACCLVQQWRVAMHAEQALDGYSLPMRRGEIMMMATRVRADTGS